METRNNTDSRKDLLLFCMFVFFLFSGYGHADDGYTGHKIDGKEIVLLHLENENGIRTALTNYGARIVAIKVPDRNGKLVDIVLGHDSLEEHLKSGDAFFGATVGRYANRIKNGRFDLEGRTCQLTKNDRRGPNHVHGGKKAFHNSVWNVIEQSRKKIEFSLKSPDGEEGYPGNLDIFVTYSLNDDNELSIDYRAISDRTTIFNPTHHSYFNLDGSGDILGHILWIDADRFTPIDAEQIPTGELRKVEGTAFDFRTATAIGQRNRSQDDQVRVGKGYNHNFVLNKKQANALEFALRIFSPRNGIAMDVYTTEPGMQIYDCGWYDGNIVGKAGQRYERFAGVALEAQHYPDSPNNPDFPSTKLEPGVPYRQTTVYKFFTK